MTLGLARIQPRWAGQFIARVKAALRRLIRRGGPRKPGKLARLQGCFRLPRRLVLFYDIPDQSSLQPEDRFDPSVVGVHFHRPAGRGAEVAARIRQTRARVGEAFEHDHLVYLGSAGERPASSRSRRAVLRLER